MNKVVTIIVFLFISCDIAYSQTVLDKINSIKQNDDYLWDEYTHNEVDSAITKASVWLLNQINDGQDGPMTLETISPFIKNIKMNRGGLTRAFVYIRKKDVPVLYGMPQQSDIDDSEGTEQFSDVDENAGVNTKAFVPDVYVQRIMQQKNFSNVYKFLAEEKKQGQILQFGALKDIEDYSSFDLILFDLNSQEVLTVLSPVTNQNKRINLVNGTIDSLDNYPEDIVAVIWYIK